MSKARKRDRHPETCGDSLGRDGKTEAVGDCEIAKMGMLCGRKQGATRKTGLTDGDRRGKNKSRTRDRPREISRA